jgi:hypothetical protein
MATEFYRYVTGGPWRNEAERKNAEVVTLCDNLGREYYVEKEDYATITTSNDVRVDATFKLPRANSRKQSQSHAMDYSHVNVDEPIQHPDEGDELTLSLHRAKRGDRKSWKQVVGFNFRAVVVEVYRYKYQKRGRVVLVISQLHT